QDGATSLRGLIAHSDAGAQYTSVAFTQRLIDEGVDPSVGSVGDCFLTPPWSRSGHGCRSSCSTPADGPPPSSWPPPWPITSTTSTTSNTVTATSVTSAQQSSKRSGRPPIRSLNSHDHGSKQRGQIVWINRSGSGHHGQHNGQVLIHVVSIWGLAHPASQPPARNSTTTGSNMRLYP